MGRSLGVARGERVRPYDRKGRFSEFWEPSIDREWGHGQVIGKSKYYSDFRAVLIMEVDVEMV